MSVEFNIYMEGEAFEKWWDNAKHHLLGRGEEGCAKISWDASRINLIQEVIELIDGLEGSWADLEYNDVLRDVIKAIVKKYGKEVE